MPTDPKSVQSRWAEEATVALAPLGLGPVEWVRETGSTNADLLAIAATGAPAGRVLVTDHQTAGRGRRERTWVTAPGDALLVSVLLRPRLPADRLGLTTAALGVAAVDGCHRLGFDQVRLKWPNDLVVGDPPRRRKLAGILAQSHVDTSGAAVVVGMGLNVIGDRLDQPDAIALGDLGSPPARLELLVAILSQLPGLLDLAATDDAEALWARYRSVSATLGTTVRCQLEDDVVVGRAVDIAPDGALLVEAAGELRKIVTGDVISVRTPG